MLALSEAEGLDKGKTKNLKRPFANAQDDKNGREVTEMNRYEHLYQTRNVQELLNGQESPFTVSEPVVDQDRVSVTVGHTTQSGELLSMTGTGRRTNGETDEELVFNALRDGVGSPNVAFVEYLGHDENPDTHKVELRSLGNHGEVFSAEADTFVGAATNTFAALSMQES